MDIQRMLAELTAERSRLDEAISALEGIDATAPTGVARRGRPPATSARAKTRGRRRMSEEARRRISEAAKARWANRKSTSGRKGTAAKKASSAPKRGSRGMSAAARKRMSEMMKARWAARKKAAKA